MTVAELPYGVVPGGFLFDLAYGFRGIKCLYLAVHSQASKQRIMKSVSYKKTNKNQETRQGQADLTAFQKSQLRVDIEPNSRSRSKGLSAAGRDISGTCQNVTAYVAMEEKRMGWTRGIP